MTDEPRDATGQPVRRICSKCHESKPLLASFRALTRMNKVRPVEVHFGWAKECLDCEAKRERKTA